MADDHVQWISRPRRLWPFSIFKALGLNLQRSRFIKMTINCSICLNIFKEPVCLPCGKRFDLSFWHFSSCSSTQATSIAPNAYLITSMVPLMIKAWRRLVLNAERISIFVRVPLPSGSPTPLTVTLGYSSHTRSALSFLLSMFRVSNIGLACLSTKAISSIHPSLCTTRLSGLNSVFCASKQTWKSGGASSST